MKYYQDLTLLPSVDVELYHIWSKFYTQIHLALVRIQDKQGNVPVGVSFPNYIYNDNCALLGNKLRLFSQDEATLGRLNLPKWLDRLSDYVHCTGIRAVPSTVEGYVIFQRYRTKTNHERLARRYAKRNDTSLEHALKHYKDFQDTLTTLPFVRIKSLTNQNSFRLIIAEKLVAQQMGDCFTSYGLSKNSSLPKF